MISSSSYKKVLQSHLLNPPGPIVASIEYGGSKFCKNLKIGRFLPLSMQQIDKCGKRGKIGCSSSNYYTEGTIGYGGVLQMHFIATTILL